MKEIELWRRSSLSPNIPYPSLSGPRMIVPAIEPMGDLPYDLAGLLPNREHGRDLLAMIDSLPPNKAGSLSVVGVFAADPFLNCRRIAHRLLAKGYDQVANIPPVAAYGSEFLATLDKVGAGRAQEQHNIKQLAECGLSVSPAVAALDDLSVGVAGSPGRLWVVPSFDMWEGTALNPDRLLGLCREIVQRTEVPVVLVASRTGISVREAADAGARGVLYDEV